MARTAEEIARASKAAFESSQLVDHADRVEALHRIKDALLQEKDAILTANKRDLEVGCPIYSICDD